VTDQTDIPDARQPSRRSILRGGVAIAGASIAAMAATAAQAQAPAPAMKKLEQAAVQYQTRPNKGQMCAVCLNFQGPNQCKVVLGPIVPIGWCVAFAPKA
jgi:anaerobic selenocysteine-containing dehydrogenase